MSVNATVNYPLAGSPIPTEGDWWRFTKNILTSGVVNDGSYTNPLQVVQHGGGTTLQVDVNPGRIICEGFYAEWGTTSTLTIAGNTSGATRVDIVVVEIDFTNHRADLNVVQGIGGAGPPSITQLPASSTPPLAGVTQIPLALVSVINNATGITTVNLTDARSYASSQGAVAHPTVASASNLAIPGLSWLTRPVHLWVPISGTVAINNITGVVGPAPPTGTVLRLKFLSAGCTVNSGVIIILGDTFTSFGNGTLTLVWDGAAWIEVGRANNQNVQRLFLATPANATGVPALRSIQDVDLPSVLSGKTFTSGLVVQGSVTLNNANPYQIKDSAGTGINLLNLSASNVVQIGSISAPTSGGDIQFYRRGTQVAAMSTAGSGVGVCIGTGVATPSFPLDVQQAQGAAQVARFKNNTTAASDACLWAEAGNASGGTCMQFSRASDDTVLGSITHNGTVMTYGGTSDERLKTHIHDADLSLADLLKLKVRRFTWKHTKDVEGIGFIAQELEQVLPPELGVVGETSDGTKTVDFGRLTPLLVAAVQELTQKVQELEKQLRDVRASGPTGPQG